MAGENVTTIVHPRKSSRTDGLPGLWSMNITVPAEAGTPVRRDRILYWISTGIIAAVMLAGALNFAFNESQKDAFRHLGLPGWFRLELTAAKLLGVLALV